jgi:hypothetical protein
LLCCGADEIIERVSGINKGGIMESKYIKIDGQTYNLSDPESKRAAIRAWLKAKAREKLGTEAVPSEENPEPLPPLPDLNDALWRGEERPRQPETHTS